MGLSKRQRDFWGVQYFNQRSWKVQLVNLLGHAIGFGMVGAGLAAFMFCWLIDAPNWLMLIPGPLFSLLREFGQWRESGKPHILDRVRDVFEACIGAVAGWALFGIWV